MMLNHKCASDHRKRFVKFPKWQFSHLHGEFPNVHERLDVLFRDVFPGHRRKGGAGLLFQVQLPAEACYRHNGTTSPHQFSTSTPDCLKQP